MPGPCCQIDLARRDIGLSAPILPDTGLVAQQRLPETSAYADAFAQLCIWRAIDAETVLAQAVSQHAFQVMQVRRGQAAGLVRPGHPALPQHPFPLSKNPIAQAVIGCPLHSQPADPYHAPGIAHHIQVEPVQRDLAELALHRRGGGQSQGHLSQFQLSHTRFIE